MEVVEEKAWAGVDVGKGFHWAHVVDASGTELLSPRVNNEEADLSALIDEALSLAEDVAWAVDQPGGGAALLLALLWERGQEVAYVPGLSVDRGRATATAASPRPTGKMLVSSPTRPGCAPTSGDSNPETTPSPGCSSCRPQARPRGRPDPGRHAAQGDVRGPLPDPQIFLNTGLTWENKDKVYHRSDHYSFNLVEYPACLASEDFLPGLTLSEANPNYHQKSDTFIDSEYAADIARAVAAAAWVTANLEGRLWG
jgi:hypothetical protein